MFTWRGKLRRALIHVIEKQNEGAPMSAAERRAERPEERGDGKEASALGNSASFSSLEDTRQHKQTETDTSRLRWQSYTKDLEEVALDPTGIARFGHEVYCKF